MSHHIISEDDFEIISENHETFPTLIETPTTTVTSNLTETYRHSIYESLHSLSSKLLGSYSGRGYLTRDEFLAAGHYLIELDSNWEWAPSPPDQKFLRASGIPCIPNNHEKKERIHYDFETNLLLSIPIVPEIDPKQFYHFYDISLTYDPAYQTPRIWLFGYGLDGFPLKENDIIQDMELDFVGSVATLIPHPITGVMNVSIHPCRHAEVMANLIQRYEAKMTGDQQFSTKEYLAIFLRLLGSIFPTMCFRTPTIGG